MWILLPLLLTTRILAAPDVYYAWGWHGGYYLTDETGLHQAFDKLFETLEANPDAKAIMEIEPYTIERMSLGEKFNAEWRGRREERLIGWSWGGPGKWELLHSTTYAHRGKNGVRLKLIEGTYVNLCQPLAANRLRGGSLIFSGYVRATRGSGAQLYIDAWDRNNYISGSTRTSRYVPPDGKWHFVSVNFTVPRNAFTIFPQAKIVSGAGVADFDDLSLTLDDRELLSNGDFETLRSPSLKEIERLQKLRELARRGRIEFVGGAYSQPIMFTIGGESAIREFTIGCRAVEMATGIPVKIYAAQEPNMIGQLPQILRQCGYRGVLYRTHWGAFGFTPSMNAEKVWWVGPDGTRIECVPLPASMRSGWGSGGISPGTIKKCTDSGIRRLLFSSLGDFVAQYIPSPDEPVMHGEIARGYANLCKRLDAKELRGKQLELSAWIRARKHGAHIYIDAHDKHGIAKAGVESPNVPADNKWHRLKVMFHVPNDAVYIFPQGRIITAEGDVDFDAISLRAVATDQELLPDGSFESNTLPEGWGVGRSQDVRCRYEIRSDAAKAGQNCVRIQMSAPAVHVKFSTLTEYFDTIAEPTREWHDAYRNFEHRFPYGLLAGRPQRADRVAEDSILRTERLMAIANITANDKIDDAWRLTLMGHHHDAWVCAPTIFGIWHSGYKRYAELTYATSEEARKICRQLTEQLKQTPSHEFALVNVTGTERDEIVHLRFELPEGLARNPVFPTMPSKCKVLSRYNEGSAKEIDAYILARNIPAMGYTRVTVKEQSPESPPSTPPSARLTEGNNTVTLENRFIRVAVSRDGLIQAYLPDGTELLREPVYIAGRFESGDLRANVKTVKGKREGQFAIAEADCRIGDAPFRMTVRLSPVSPLIHLTLEFDFGGKTVVGAGQPVPNRPSPRIPVWARDELKLRFVAPLNMDSPRFLGHEAFELREPYELRLPILRYAVAHDDRHGIAIYTDRATMGIFDGKKRELAVVLGYGGKFIYAPGQFAPLKGAERYELALYLFNGDLEHAMIAQRADEFAQPVIAIPGAKKFAASRSSLVKISPSQSVMMTASYRTEDATFVRLWRPYKGNGKFRITITNAKSIWRTNLRGKRIERLTDSNTAIINLRHNQIITVAGIH